MTARGRILEWLALAVVFTVVAATAAVWLARDRHPPEWDYANHLERAVLCAQDVARGEFTTLLERSTFYPPLAICVAGLAYRLYPSDVAAAQAAILGFLAAGMIAVYLIARRFSGGIAGVVAATAFATAPLVVYLTVRFQLDLPLAAMVALCLLAALATDDFTRRGRAVAAGVVFGLGMLTKATLPVYVVLAILILVVRGRRAGALVNAGLSVVVAALVALPWYGPRLLGLPAQFANRSFRQAAESGHPDPFTAAALGYYPSQFPTQFGVVAVALFVIGIVVAVRRRAWFVVAGAFAPFALFLLVQNKNLRYTLPLLPMAAVAAGLGFAALPRLARAAVAVALLTASVLQLSTTAFAVPANARLPWLGTSVGEDTPPDPRDWRHREILALLEGDSRGAPARVSVVPNHAFFSVANFRYYGLRDGLPLRFARAWDDPPLGIEYMILKTGDVGPPWTAEKPRRIRERFDTDGDFARVFPVIGEFSLPDGSTATVRARRIPGDVGAPPARLAEAVESAFRARLSDVARGVTGLRVRLTYDAEIARGRIARIDLLADVARIAEWKRRDAAALTLRDLHVVLDDVRFNPLAAWHGHRFDLLDVGRFRLERATIGAGDLREFLAALRGFGGVRVTLGPGFADVAVRLPGPDVDARVRVFAAADRPFALAAERVRLGGVPVPGPFVNWVVRNFDPSLRLARLPIPTELGRVSVTSQAIQVGAP
ncbi:MAG: LmeA family phospholipid-binding protein [Candidatus Rokubacteria bacterium]|nr:LmeA family phospholipid-binding protein [Candidatus Rokubacteria bacterium]